MIHVVTARNKGLYRDQLEEHHRIRYDIYVRERRWMALDRPDGRELDQFDDEHALYLLALEDERVVGGTRLVPTLRPHLMSEVFPRLASVRGLQRGADIVEWTRIFVIPARRGGDSKVLHSVLAGMFEFCLDEGVSSITVVMETWWMPRFLELGWRVRPLGLTEELDGMTVVACIIDVTAAALANTKAAKGLVGPMLIRRGLAGPVLPTIAEEIPYAKQ